MNARRVLDAGAFRHIVTGVASAVLAAALVGLIGYYGVINRLDERVADNEAEITALRIKVDLSQDDRGELKLVVKGLEGEVKTLNAILGELRDRLNRADLRRHGGPVP